MGRSVIPHPNATVTAYATFETSHWCDECEEWSYAGEECPHAPYSCAFGCDHSDEYREYLQWISDTAREIFPSMSDVDAREVSRWSENYVIAENSHSEISVSEYCGMVAISLAPRSDLADHYWEDTLARTLGETWRKRVSQRFLEQFGEYQKLGTMSNGESVFAPQDGGMTHGS